MYKLYINKEEVLRYLGFKNNEVDTETLNEMEKATKLLSENINYKTTYKVFDIDKSDEIKLKGTSLVLEGIAIKKLLEDCDKCILMAVTLGQSADNIIRKLQLTSLSTAVVADFCASSMVENICNQFEEDIKKQYENQFFTDRFSPGYGDLPLDIQAKFCTVLNTEKTVGINVSSSGIMLPRKSITAIIGIADKAQKMKIKGCKYCSLLKNCEYRKGGKTCD